MRCYPRRRRRRSGGEDWGGDECDVTYGGEPIWHVHKFLSFKKIVHKKNIFLLQTAEPTEGRRWKYFTQYKSFIAAASCD
jgi:hypothetical protein